MTTDSASDGAITKSRKPTTTIAADETTETGVEGGTDAATDLTSKLFRKISTDTVKKILELLCDEGG